MQSSTHASTGISARRTRPDHDLAMICNLAVAISQKRKVEGPEL
jgi:hypothetical protein